MYVVVVKRHFAGLTMENKDFIQYKPIYFFSDSGSIFCFDMQR